MNHLFSPAVPHASQAVGPQGSFHVSQPYPMPLPSGQLLDTSSPPGCIETLQPRQLLHRKRSILRGPSWQRKGHENKIHASCLMPHASASALPRQRRWIKLQQGADNRARIGQRIPQKDRSWKVRGRMTRAETMA
jgi:hypothetical protein